MFLPAEATGVLAALGSLRTLLTTPAATRPGFGGPARGPGVGGVPAPGSPWPPPPGLLGPGLGSGTTDGSGTASGKPPGSK